MKISYLITRAECGGAQSHLLELIRGVREKGVEASLIVGEEGFLCAAVREIGVPVSIVPSLVPQVSPRNDVCAIREIRQLLAGIRPDLIHAHSSKAGLIGRISARILGTPSVFTAHGWAFTQGTSLARKAIAIPSEYIGGRVGSAVIAVSENDYALAQKYRICRRSRLFMISNAVKTAAKIADPGASPPIIISVARLAPPKDPVLILKALAGCSGDFRLWLVGDGPLRAETEREAERLGLTSRTVFWGTRTDVVDLLAQAQMFVLASDYEGLPISILEAMSAGLPVIASKVGGVSELVIQGETGIQVAPKSVVELRNALQHFILDPESRRKAADLGRARAVMCFSMEQMVSKTMSVYDTVLRQIVRERVEVPLST